MKKLLLLGLTLTTCLFLSGCGDDEDSTALLPTFSNVSIFESMDTDYSNPAMRIGGIEVIIDAVNATDSIYVVLVAEGAKKPTAEQIKAGDNYDGVVVIEALNSTNKMYEFIEDGITRGTSYDVHSVIQDTDGVFSNLYSTTVHTYTEEELENKGSGTQNDPYMIYTLADLEKVGVITASNPDALSMYYKMAADIDMSGTYNEEDGSFTPLCFVGPERKKFAGHFDGNGFVIKNIYIDVELEGAGLFGEIDAAGTVTGVTIIGGSITNTGKQRTGGIAGYNKGVISNCSVFDVTITSTGSATGRVGGIVGEIYDSGSLINVATKVDIYSEGKSNGGIAGIIQVSSGLELPVYVTNAYSASTIYSTADEVGGIIGQAKGYIILSDCVFNGVVTGQKSVGGIIGTYGNSDAIFSNCLVLSATITGTQGGFHVGNASTSGGVMKNWTVGGNFVRSTDCVLTISGTEYNPSLIDDSELLSTILTETYLFETFELSPFYQFVADGKRPVFNVENDNGNLV